MRNILLQEACQNQRLQLPQGKRSTKHSQECQRGKEKRDAPSSEIAGIGVDITFVLPGK